MLRRTWQMCDISSTVMGLTVVAAHNEAVLARVLAVTHGARRVVVGAPKPNVVYGGQPLFRA